MYAAEQALQCNNPLFSLDPSCTEVESLLLSLAMVISIVISITFKLHCITKSDALRTLDSDFQFKLLVAHQWEH